MKLIDVYLLAKFLNLIFLETKRLVKKLRGQLHFQIILVNQQKTRLITTELATKLFLLKEYSRKINSNGNCTEMSRDIHHINISSLKVILAGRYYLCFPLKDKEIIVPIQQQIVPPELPAFTNFATSANRQSERTETWWEIKDQSGGAKEQKRCRKYRIIGGGGKSIVTHSVARKKLMGQPNIFGRDNLLNMYGIHGECSFVKNTAVLRAREIVKSKRKCKVRSFKCSFARNEVV
ncbi:hypothetical protein WN51_11777 [Melipona quadrifasciata]|uniref:Uncharacterized protein n=1 Tax=Melipona quadrifasciata TaxID=166423 RepID=A0A0N1ITT0_9HYME|nr:hypothetical protein WN51_11777 [Melipona quadrifasciata]